MDFGQERQTADLVVWIPLCLLYCLNHTIARATKTQGPEVAIVVGVKLAAPPNTIIIGEAGHISVGVGSRDFFLSIDAASARGRPLRNTYC